jgi:hypothetical protein
MMILVHFIAVWSMWNGDRLKIRQEAILPTVEICEAARRATGEPMDYFCMTPEQFNQIKNERP